MKISELKVKPFTSFLNTYPEACPGVGPRVMKAPWVSSALSFKGGVHIGARALHALNWLAISLAYPGGEKGGNFLVQVISNCILYAKRSRVGIGTLWVGTGRVTPPPLFPSWSVDKWTRHLKTTWPLFTSSVSPSCLQIIHEA